MAGIKGMYVGPRPTWAEVQKKFDWFKAYRPEIAKYGIGTGVRMARLAFIPKLKSNMIGHQNGGLNV